MASSPPLKSLLYARNIALPGGQLDLGQKNLIIDPSGQFDSVKAIGDVIVRGSPGGSPVYLRDLVDISRGYQSPRQLPELYTWRDPAGRWHRTRAITLAIFMNRASRSGIRPHMDRDSNPRKILPRDLIMARTSDQPRQVEEKHRLFMDALYEAIVPGHPGFAGRLLGMALGSVDGAGDSDYLGDEFRGDLSFGNRCPAGIDRGPHHRPGTACR